MSSSRHDGPGHAVSASELPSTSPPSPPPPQQQQKQQQQPQPLLSPSSSLSPSEPSAQRSNSNSNTRSIMPLPAWWMSEETRNRILKQYRIPVASATSTVIATLSVTPLENLKTRMQTHNFQGVRDCARYLWRAEGIRGYTAGALPPLATVTVVRVINFTVYQRVKYAFSDAVERTTGVSPLKTYNTPGSLPTLSTVSCFMFSGMVAGVAAAPLACPFELAKNVVQTSVLVTHRSHASMGSGSRNQSLRHIPRLGTMEAIMQIVSRHGFRGLYAGLGLHATRDCVGTGLYFSIYETGKQLMSTCLGESTTSLWSSMAAGALCGVLPWFCTYSLDTRKTRAQSILLGKAKEIGEASMAVARSSMYKGLSVILCRTAVQNMLLLSTFEYFKGRIAELDD